MTSPMHNRIEQAMADLERQREAVAGLQGELATAETVITPKNRAISITLDGQGELVDVRFPTSAYRTMAPAELGRLITDTVRQGRDEARHKAVQMFAALLPSGVPVMEMLNGPVDYDAVRDEITAAFREAQRDLPEAGR